MSSKLPDFLFQSTGWNHEKNPIWIGSTLHLYRNFALYKFPGKMTPAEMAGSQKTIVEACQKIPSLQPLTFLPAEELSPLDKELLFEHFQCSQGLQEAQMGQGFAFNSQGNCLILLHLHNHLQIHIVEPSDDLISAWLALSKMDADIGRINPYAFSSNFGYLTADPMVCGTALEVRLLLHIPALRHTGALGEILRNCGDEQLLFLSLEGAVADLVGDILILKNHYTLGVAEETLLNLLKTAALKIAQAEKTACDRLKDTPSPELKDFVGRSFGLLMHSYQLYPKEALDGLSGLKLGVHLGWVSGVSPQKLNTLMLQLRRAHLTHLLHLGSPDLQELSHKRAEWLHQELKGIAIIE